ncbi:Uma2 family endonuclease [Methylocystis heyeri]|uniref:Uma2 family endonuclease n=1 Tax=Methylocystis heyeri TaxID=391905 RepID=A0A6B8K9L7_9HYPH|nr:Uma2 family endonuclease [Methylocystis heyeri]QGM44539.1 Uma2 family endonuclease [Methylocystis heyeri]
MSAQPPTPPHMTVDEFLVWASERPGRHELINGEVVSQSAERAAHWKVKLAVHVALLNAVRAGGLNCHVVPDGATVRIDDATAYEPNALVYCGEEAAPSALTVDNPVIIVEVLSPSTGRMDRARKLADYFRLPSLAHYLIVDSNEPLVIHHRRQEGCDILTRIIREGATLLDPPGLEVVVAEIYGAS